MPRIKLLLYSIFNTIYELIYPHPNSQIWFVLADNGENGTLNLRMYGFIGTEKEAKYYASKLPGTVLYFTNMENLVATIQAIQPSSTQSNGDE